MQISGTTANLPQPGLPAGCTHNNYQCSSGLCACGWALWVLRLPSTCTSEVADGRIWRQYGSLPECGPATNGHLFFLPGGGELQERINAGLPAIHTLGKYLLSAYYVPLHQLWEEEPDRGRTLCWCFTRRKFRRTSEN